MLFYLWGGPCQLYVYDIFMQLVYIRQAVGWACFLYTGWAFFLLVGLFPTVVGLFRLERVFFPSGGPFFQSGGLFPKWWDFFPDPFLSHGGPVFFTHEKL